MEMPYPNGMLPKKFEFSRATLSVKPAGGDRFELVGTCTDLLIADECCDFIFLPYEHHEDLSIDRLMSSASVRALR